MSELTQNNITKTAALNHVFTCTQCTVYVQYMCINSAAWNKTAKAERRKGGKAERRKGRKSKLKFKVGFDNKFYKNPVYR